MGSDGKWQRNSPGFPDMGSSTPGSVAARHHAFHTRVEPEIEVLLRVAATVTGSWADAEDLVQETLIRAYRAIDGFDGAYPRAWLLTILRNTNLNSHRRRRPDLAGDRFEWDGHRPAFGASAVPVPGDVVVDRVFDDVVQRAVAGLDPKFRTVLLLIDVDQLTYAEVAEVLGVPVGTVMSRLSRARDKVRARLGHSGRSGKKS